MARMQSAARGVLVMFGISVILFVLGGMCLWTTIGIGGPITGTVLMVLGGIMLIMTMMAYVGIARWNAKRRAGWQRLAVRVALDHAQGEKDKTLIDTADGIWRIALLNYPLELRDKVEQDGEVEYIGELAHKKPVVIRPVGAASEFLGYARSLASLRERQ